MSHIGVENLFSIGHSAHPGNFSYLAGSAPGMGWTGVVLGTTGEPVIVSGGGSRELPFARQQTWIEDIHTSRSLFAGPAEAALEVLGERAAVGSKVALIGAREELGATAYAELMSRLETYEVLDGDAMIYGLRAVKRPRERMSLERSLIVAREAVAAGRRLWETGGSTAEAMIETERTARRHGAREARTLANLSPGSLMPLETKDGYRGTTLALYCAVDVGYWAQASACVGGEGAEDLAKGAVHAMTEGVRPGLAAGDLARNALAVLPEASHKSVLSYGLGAGIGLDLSEPPIVEPDSTGLVRDGTALALQAVVSDDGEIACYCETVLVDADGVFVL